MVDETISFEGRTSPDVHLHFGITQRSIHYVDDTHVNITLSPKESLDDTSSSIKVCIAGIVNWINSNMLKVNHRKIESVVFSTKT